MTDEQKAELMRLKRQVDILEGQASELPENSPERKELYRAASKVKGEIIAIAIKVKQQENCNSKPENSQNEPKPLPIPDPDEYFGEVKFSDDRIPDLSYFDNANIDPRFPDWREYLGSNLTDEQRQYFDGSDEWNKELAEYFAPSAHYQVSRD